MREGHLVTGCGSLYILEYKYKAAILIPSAYAIPYANNPVQKRKMRPVIKIVSSESDTLLLSFI